MPKISFIVPVYNVAPFLRECLDSLVNQSFKDLEILAVNDGSTDGSPQILREYEDRFPRLVRVFHKENGGLSDARNFGLEKATGDYISFVDSDDFVHPDLARTAVEKMEKEHLDLLLFDYFYAFSSGKTVAASALPYGKEEDARSLLTAAPMAWLRVYRRSLLPKAPFRKGIYYEDLEMTPRMLLSAQRARYLPTPLYYYRQREGSIMKESSFSEKWLDIFTVTESVAAYFEKEKALETYENELEFLLIEHLLRSAALRFAPFPEGKELLPKLKQAVEDRFPRWKENPYLARTSIFFRTVVFFSARGSLPALRILKKLKG